MNRFLSVAVVFAALCAPALVLAQQVAGRVLAAAGDVSILRGAERVAAVSGTAVSTGDTVNLGPQSSAQLRFSDDSIVSLRANTSFRIAEYVFRPAEPGAQRAFFDLLKGGMRTVTGAIGRGSPVSYRVDTANAHVGIRGTSYTLVLCDNSCLNPDGTAAPNGTYGAVTEGRIGVINQTGERQFGADEFFYVANQFTSPVQLLAPPSFILATRPRPSAAQQAQAAQKAGAAAAAASVAQAADAAGSGVPTDAAPPLLTPVAYQVTSTAEPQSLLSQASFTGNSFFRVQGPFDLPVSCSGSQCPSVVAGEFTLGVSYALQRGALLMAFKDSNGGIFNVGTPFALSGFPIRIVGNQITFSATFNLVDFPTQQGTFRCSACGPGGGPGFASQITISGTITGSQADITVTLTSATANGSFSATLTQAPLPNNAVGAIVTPRQAGGMEARSASFWNVSVDGSGRLQRLAPAVGGPAAFVGSATNTILGSAQSAGNLVWGIWGGGAQVTDSNYATFTTTTAQPLVWITGDAPNSLPQSLGSLTFNVVGSAFTGTNQRLNSASLSADFVNRSLSLSINATNVTAGNTFQMNATTGFSPTTGRFSAAFNSVACSGPCIGGTAAGSYAGFFSGPQAQGAGVAYTVGFGLGTGVTGVVGFGR